MRPDASKELPQSEPLSQRQHQTGAGEAASATRKAGAPIDRSRATAPIFSPLSGGNKSL